MCSLTFLCERRYDRMRALAYNLWLLEILHKTNPSIHPTSGGNLVDGWINGLDGWLYIQIGSGMKSINIPVWASSSSLVGHVQIDFFVEQAGQTRHSKGSPE